MLLVFLTLAQLAPSLAIAMQHSWALGSGRTSMILTSCRTSVLKLSVLAPSPQISAKAETKVNGEDLGHHMQLRRWIDNATRPHPEACMCP